MCFSCDLDENSFPSIKETVDFAKVAAARCRHAQQTARDHDMADQHEYDARLAMAAIEHLQPGSVVGVGAGSACNHFVKVLHELRVRVEAAVACSGLKIAMLKQYGVPTIPLEEVNSIDLFVGTADEVTRRGLLIRSKTGFFTQEKRAACIAKKYLCLTTVANLVQALGSLPIPLEVSLTARDQVTLELRQMGANPILRARYKTDRGNAVLDVRGLDLSNPVETENRLAALSGVVDSGLFARRPADVLLVAEKNKIKVHQTSQL